MSGFVIVELPKPEFGSLESANKVCGTGHHQPWQAVCGGLNGVENVSVDGASVSPEIIEAMCRAYWNERGSFKWKNEGEQYRESIRCRMRAAVKVQHEMIATETVLAPRNAPNPVSFSKPPLPDMPNFRTDPAGCRFWNSKTP